MSVTFSEPPQAFAAASTALDAVAGIERMMASLSAVKAQLISNAYDSVLADLRLRPVPQSGHARAEHARQTLVTELAPLLRITSGSAAQLVAESRALAAHLPLTLTALGRGEVSYRHAQVVVDHAALLPDEGIAAFEAAVLPDATRLNVARFRDRARRIRGAGVSSIDVPSPSSPRQTGWRG